MLRSLTLSLLLVSSAAHAQDASWQKRHQACAADATRLCASVTPGHGAVTRCMRGHMDALTAPCRSAIQERMAALQGRRGESGGMSKAPPAAQPDASPH